MGAIIVRGWNSCPLRTDSCAAGGREAAGRSAALAELLVGLGDCLAFDVPDELFGMLDA